MDPAKYVIGFGDPCQHCQVVAVSMFFDHACIRPFLRLRCCNGLYGVSAYIVGWSSIVCHTGVDRLKGS
jgi:hypothetical protein